MVLILVLTKALISITTLTIPIIGLIMHSSWCAFQSQQAKINELQKKINNVNEVLSKANIKDDRFSLEFALNEIEELLK